MFVKIAWLQVTMSDYVNDIAYLLKDDNVVDIQRNLVGAQNCPALFLERLFDSTEKVVKCDATLLSEARAIVRLLPGNEVSYVKKLLEIFRSEDNRAILVLKLLLRRNMKLTCKTPKPVRVVKLAKLQQVINATVVSAIRVERALFFVYIECGDKFLCFFEQPRLFIYVKTFKISSIGSNNFLPSFG